LAGITELADGSRTCVGDDRRLASITNGLQKVDAAHVWAAAGILLGSGGMAIEKLVRGRTQEKGRAAHRIERGGKCVGKKEVVRPQRGIGSFPAPRSGRRHHVVHATPCPPFCFSLL
jgi:hypothetical protein